jgi:hypothetical protein
VDKGDTLNVLVDDKVSFEGIEISDAFGCDLDGDIAVESGTEAVIIREALAGQSASSTAYLSFAKERRAVCLCPFSMPLDGLVMCLVRLLLL